MQEQNSKYDKMMKIGEGAYGAVYKACDKNTKRIVALKITKFSVDDEGIPSTALRQISILKSLNNEYIVKQLNDQHRLLDVSHYIDKEQFVIQLVFEYMDQDLGKFIKRRKDNVCEEEYKMIFKKIIQGVKYLHDNKVYHRDLKPQNILINQKKQVKIADFGLSRVIVNPSKTFSKEIETLWYRSPELLLGIKYYGTGVDIWSLGCIFYELVEGKALFKGDSEVSQILLIFGALGTPKVADWPSVIKLPHFKGTLPKLHGKPPSASNMSSLGYDLLMKMIQINPQKRISINGVLKHPFFS